MEQLLQPVIGGQRSPNALPSVAGQLGGWLLAEQPERFGSQLKIASLRRVGEREQAHREPDHYRIDTGLEESDPGSNPE